MRLFRDKLLEEEMGAEGPTSEGGSEEEAAVEEGGFDFDAWLSDDEDADDVDVDGEEADEEEEEEPAAEEEEAPAEEEKPAPETEKWTLKIDGEEVEYDPSNVEDTKAWVQKGMAAQKTWQEAGKIRQQTNQFIESFKSNPRALLENPALGVDAVKLAEEILYDRLQEEGMSESEREMRQKLREYEAKEHGKFLEQRKQEQEQKRAEQERTIQSVRQTLEASGIPATQENIQTAFKYMADAQQAGLVEVDPTAVMDFVKRDFTSKQREYLGNMDVEKLMEFLGQDKVEAIRKHNVQKILEKRKAPKPKATAKSKKKEEPNYVGDLSDWLNR